MEILRADGFTVTTERSFGTMLFTHKLENGIPQGMTSCHTGEVEGYTIEGHVPTADIRRILVKRPDAVGLAVPGMPYGSPGMGSEDNREAYDVFLIRGRQHGGLHRLRGRVRPTEWSSLLWHTGRHVRAVNEV